jgi:hypothetical protein
MAEELHMCAGCCLPVLPGNPRWAAREPDQFWHHPCAQGAGVISPSLFATAPVRPGGYRIESDTEVKAYNLLGLHGAKAIDLVIRNCDDAAARGAEDDLALWNDVFNLMYGWELDMRGKRR